MIVGIDAGTSVVKAAALSEEGEDFAVAGSQVALDYSSTSECEQDFEEIAAAVGEVVRRVVAAAGLMPRMIALTGQGDGLWLYDELGKPVRKGISWLDARGNDFVKRWMESGVFERVYRRSGNIVFPGSQAPLLRALSEREPDVLERAATAGYCKDGVMQRLTGERMTDASDASLPFLDVKSLEYDPKTLDLFGLERYARLLAPVEPAPGGMYPLEAEGAALTGLPEGLPVHAGPFDLPACALGAGVSRVGDGLVTLGTTLACQVLVDRVDTTGEPGGMTLCNQREGLWLRAMPAMVGTASLDLALELIGKSLEDVDTLLDESPPGALGLHVLPFFSASGERAPFVEPNARGQLSGMTLSTTRADVVRAVCESVGYAARHCLEAAGLEGEVFICGGGAESGAWLQILADILRRPVSLARRPEVGARGAAIAALEASGESYDHEGWTRPEGVVEPREEYANLYEDGFALYLRHIEVARRLWSETPEKEPQV